MRWLVHRAPARQPRFGETARDVLAWTVQPYVTLGDGSRQFLKQPVPFTRLAAAHAHATAEARRFAAAAERNHPTPRLRVVA